MSRPPTGAGSLSGSAGRALACPGIGPDPEEVASAHADIAADPKAVPDEVEAVRARDRRLSVAAGVLACGLLVAGCAGTSLSPSPAETSTFAAANPFVAVPTVPSWFNVEMTDVTTGKQFKISDFTGRVVLLDTMATWCPTCQGEMSQVQQLPGLLGPSVDLVRVSLDVDPNEDASILKKFAAANQFDWYIAVAPIEVGRFLEVNYDQGYLNPPLQPMLIIDRTGGVYGLPFGIKSAESIGKTLAQYLAQ
jgi:thiol-disulfide isomerase/thioredoxin